MAYWAKWMHSRGFDHERRQIALAAVVIGLVVVALGWLAEQPANRRLRRWVITLERPIAAAAVRAGVWSVFPVSLILVSWLTLTTVAWASEEGRTDEIAPENQRQSPLWEARRQNDMARFKAALEGFRGNAYLLMERILARELQAVLRGR